MGSWVVVVRPPTGHPHLKDAVGQVLTADKHGWRGGGGSKKSQLPPSLSLGQRRPPPAFFGGS